MGGLYFDGKLVSPVIEKEVAKTKFGADVDTWIGEVDTDGQLNTPTSRVALDFAGVKTIGANVMMGMFFFGRAISSAVFSSLTTIMRYGMYYAFRECGNMKSIDLGALKTVEQEGLFSAFYKCTALTDINLSALETLGANAMANTFYNCIGLTKMSFPALKNVQANSFGATATNGAFRGCTNLTEIHFREDMQATIEAMNAYADKWGAPSTCTIYFDL